MHKNKLDSDFIIVNWYINKTTIIEFSVIKSDKISIPLVLTIIIKKVCHYNLCHTALNPILHTHKLCSRVL